MLKYEVGQVAKRYLAGIVKPMELKVTEVTPSRIICGPWEFDKLTGAEIDEDLCWGPLTGTGSYIREDSQCDG